MHRVLSATLMAALTLSLAACSTRSTQLEVAPSAPPEPPRVDCADKTGEQPLPAHPRTHDDVGWPVWAARMYGVVEVERKARKREHRCLDDLREAGVIR